MILVYVAGPYSGNSIETHRNVECALETGVRIVEMGAYPVIPHTNTPPCFDDVALVEFMYRGTLELMRRCDAVVMCGAWASSKGATSEKEEAERLGIPVFFNLKNLRIHLAASGVV